MAKQTNVPPKENSPSPPADSARPRKAGLADGVGDVLRKAMEGSPRPTLPPPLHPAGEGMTRQTRSDTFGLDPKRIVLEGYYVRDPGDDADFEGFKEGVRTRGEIDIPISVRTTGPITARKYILVWGRRRLTAALQLGFPLVPVRTFGEIDETESIKLQLQENLNRRAMTPVETAHAFHELNQRGVANVEIARIYGRTQSYVSYMVRTGEALARFSDSERHELNRSGLLKVRLCQEIAGLDSVDERVAALHAFAASDVAQARPLAAGDGTDDVEAGSGPTDAPNEGEAGKAPQARKKRRRPSRTKRADEEALFSARPLRNQRGRTFRVRWTEDDLAKDPEGFVQQFSDVIRSEISHLVSRLEERRAIAANGGLAPDVAAQFEKARSAAVKLAGWLRSEAAADSTRR